MLLWIGMAAIAAAVTYAVVRPLLRSSAEADADGMPADPKPDVAIYRDQLRELETDQERGLMTSVEAQSARAEVGRRLIAAAAEAKQPSQNAAARVALHGRILPVLLFGLPLGALAGYLYLGQPELPAKPFAERLRTPINQATPADLIARVEAQLRIKPDDARGWDVIAPIYLQLGRYADAAAAFSNAMQYGGETPQRLSGFADARVGQENGIIPDDARRAYERIVALAPDRFDARLRIALAKEQDGKAADAIADIKALLAAAPADAPWRPMVERRLQRMQDAAAGKTTDTDATSTPDDRQRAALTAYVADLSNQLKAAPGDLNLWLNLIRTHNRLGHTADVGSAISSARRQFASDSRALDAIERLTSSFKPGT